MKTVLQAMDQTLAIAREHGQDKYPEWVLLMIPPEMRYAHLVSMRENYLRRIDTFSDRKAGSWLGWMQAAVMGADAVATVMLDRAKDFITLDTFKEVNTGIGE